MSCGGDRGEAPREGCLHPQNHRYTVIGGAEFSVPDLEDGNFVRRRDRDAD
jgi:hypothetical protein